MAELMNGKTGREAHEHMFSHPDEFVFWKPDDDERILVAVPAGRMHAFPASDGTIRSFFTLTAKEADSFLEGLVRLKGVQ